MEFEFATVSRILFGPGKLREIGAHLKTLGNKALVVTGRDQERAGPLLSLLELHRIVYDVLRVPGEPTTSLISRGAQYAKEEQCDLVIGFGGGSALDAGKAIAALLTNSGELLDYLEVIGKGKQLSLPAAPCVAVPTTAGTGAEVTRNAVLASPEQRLKVSLRSPFVLPRIALVDPELTCNLPPSLTASTGLDALTQLIEPFVSIRANPLADAVCREGIPRVAGALRRAYGDGSDIAARTEMALASLLSGLALANAGLGAVHGFAASIGGMFTAPHGAVCAALLPQVMSANLRVLRQRQPDSQSLKRYSEIAGLLTGHKAATAEEGIRWIEELCHDLGIQRLSSFGVSNEDFPIVIEGARNANSMKGNPISLSAADMEEILARSL